MNITKRIVAITASLTLASAAGILGSGIANAGTTVAIDDPITTWAGARVMVHNLTATDAGWCTYYSRPSGWKFDTVVIPFTLPGNGHREVLVPGAQPTGQNYWVRVSCSNAPTKARVVMY